MTFVYLSSLVSSSLHSYLHPSITPNSHATPLVRMALCCSSSSSSFKCALPVASLLRAFCICPRRWTLCSLLNYHIFRVISNPWRLPYSSGTRCPVPSFTAPDSAHYEPRPHPPREPLVHISVIVAVFSWRHRSAPPGVRRAPFSFCTQFKGHARLRRPCGCKPTGLHVITRDNRVLFHSPPPNLSLFGQ